MIGLHSLIDFLLLRFVGLSLIAVVAICFMQVAARYAFNASFSWAEEISITILLWAVWGGACLAVKSNSHLRVVFLENKVQPRTKLILRIGLNSLFVLFLGVIAYASKAVVNANENITLMSLPISVNVMYWSTPSGCLLMIYYCLRSLRCDWAELNNLNGREG